MSSRIKMRQLNLSLVQVCGKMKREKKPVVLKTRKEDDPDRELLKLSYEIGLDKVERDPVTKMFHCMVCDHQVRVATPQA